MLTYPVSLADASQFSLVPQSFNSPSFVIAHGFVAMTFDELVPFGGFEVFADHFGDEFVEGGFGGPAEFFLGFGGVTEEGFDFGGAEIPIVDSDDHFLSLTPSPSPQGGGEKQGRKGSGPSPPLPRR